MGNLVSGYRVTCAVLTPSLNSAFNERAALVFLVVTLFFIAWHVLSCVRQWVQAGWFQLWPAYGLIVDQASPAMFSAAMGLAIATNLCYTQPLIVGSQLVALAMFTHASGWMFVETVAEFVTHAIGLASLVFPTITIWTLAQEIANNPDQGWYGNHDPRWYLLTGIIVEALTTALCLVLYGLRWSMLHSDSEGAHLFVPSGADMLNAHWQMGWSGVVARRARLLCRGVNMPVAIRRLSWIKLIVVAVLVAVASFITGIRTILTFRDAVSYNKADKAGLYSAASGSAMIALLLHPFSVAHMALIALCGPV